MKSELAFCQTFTILHYYTAAEYNIAVIEHNVLSRSYRSYLFIKHDPDRISVLRIYGTRLNITFTDPQLRERKFAGVIFRDQPLQKAVDILSKVSNVHFRQKGNVIEITENRPQY